MPKSAMISPVSRPRAALRVPTYAGQLGLSFPKVTPHLFVHEGTRQLLEKRLSAAMCERVVLSITDNRHTMISSTWVGSHRRIRLHHMFLEADTFTVRALSRYIQLGNRSASIVIGQYIDAHRHCIRTPESKSIQPRTEGTKYDLRAIFDKLNQHYFAGSVDATITWGRQPNSSRRRRCSIKLGSYSAEERLIRVHPVLDQEWVPEFFIEYIVFHEMLHQVVPARARNGRTHYHCAQFRMREKLFVSYERAIRWEKRHIDRLLSG